MSEKQYKKLPGAIQTTVIKNFFESTVEQLFSKSNVENLSAYIGRKEFDDYNPSIDTYIKESTADREKYSLEPVVNSIDQLTGESTNLMFYEDFLNVLKSYEVDTKNQNRIFDTNFYSFLPPIDIDKFVNYQEYFWSPTGPAPITITGTAEQPINILKDILGKKFFTDANGYSFKNGAVVEFAGDYVIPASYKDKRFIVEGVGDAIILYNKEQNFSAQFSTPAPAPWDQEVITSESNLILTDIPQGAISESIIATHGYYDSGSGRYYYYDELGQATEIEVTSLSDTNLDGQPYWEGYNAGAEGFLSYINDGIYGFDAEPWDGGNTQENPDYILMQRGSIDNNIWSRINFWHHKQTFIDADTALPGKEYRAKRPILEFDRNIELYNFGTTGKNFSVDLVAEEYTKEQTEGRPISAPIDSQGIKAQNLILIPNDTKDISKYVYVVNDRVSATVVGNVTNATAFIVDSTDNIFQYAQITSDSISSTTLVSNIDVSTNTIYTDANVTLTDGDTVTFQGRVILTRHPDESNPEGAVDGDGNFVPYEPETGDSLSVLFGSQNQGREYYWNGEKWTAGQQKSTVNTPIKFKSYDNDRVSLDDELIYPQSDFAGSKIFSYKRSSTNTLNDSVLGFPLDYKNFSNFSEIVFENNFNTDVTGYIPFGGTSTQYIKGYRYYKIKLSNGDTEYRTMWRGHPTQFSQQLEDRYVVSQENFDNSQITWLVSGTPIDNNSVRVYVNGIRRLDFTFNSNLTAVVFNSFNLDVNDVIDIKTRTNTGYILDDDRSGRYELPLSWNANTDKLDIAEISEPQYLEHFKDYMFDQELISGDVLGSNNFKDLDKKLTYADKIVQTDNDLQQAAFLLSNENINIIDALRFNADEYIKYKNRLKKEIKRYINNNDVSTLTDSEILEFAIQNVIAFNPGKLVFDYSYMLPIGDRYDEESFVINNINQLEYSLTDYIDLSKIENSVLVYDNKTGTDTMLLVDYDYTINSDNNILTLTFSDSYDISLGSTIKVRLFNKNRESAQCPPSPSAMGLYPVFKPEIVLDSSFREPINVIVGHDGSKTVADNDRQDNVLLEFERRVFNNTLQVFRDKTSHPDLNVFDIRSGRFRDTGYSRTEFFNILRQSFNKFIARNDVDFVKNEYYDKNNYWTWNYNYGTASPSYWRGIFESCYDTDRPHTHPWEMLGFVKKPSWWEEQYGTDYGLTNTQLWKDLEEGIIRQGTRANVENDRYKTNNPFRRIGLKNELPIGADGNLLPPANIVSTTSTTKSIDWVETSTGTATANADSFLVVDGFSVFERIDGSNTFINLTTNNIINHDTGVFPTEDNINEIASTEFSYTLELASNVQPSGNLSYYNDFANAESTSNTAVGICVNGGLIQNANTGIQFENSSNWHYNAMYRNEVSRDTAGGSPDSNNIYGYVQPSPQSLDLTEWDDTVHSPIVGWAFDGLPIYGPYGYTDFANTSSAIKRIESSYALRTGLRTDVASGATGAPTGEFVEDYYYSAASGDLDQFNGRWGITPEFPAGTYYYVATINADGTPAYPYTVGPKFINQTTQLANNVSGAAVISTAGTQTYALNSTETTTYSANATLASSNWKFGDGAPVENAWKISEYYPFAIAEALFLTKPGKFASVFAEPEKIIRGSANTLQLLDRNTLKRFKVKNSRIHGDIDTDGKTLVTNTGYTQFIDSYLRFQGLNNSTTFGKPFKSVNGKLGHKFAGFVDKDTMTVFSDSYSTTGNSSSLILPQEDIQLNVHVGPASSTNHYTGVLIELTESGYKVSGYSSLKRYFDIEQSNTQGARAEISVGGDPADYSQYDTDTNYSDGNIVKSGYNFYRAKGSVPKGSNVTDTTYWQRLSSLPSINGAEATLYLEGTGLVQRVEYGTVYSTVDSLFDFLISLGRHQKSLGYDFGEYNAEIADVNDWTYSAKQFLFWSLGNWSTGNTLNLSPLATKVRFVAPRGRIDVLKESYKGQFSILDQEGKSISPKNCEIVREGNVIEISPIGDVQIYGIVLHTNEIEHTMIINNKTVFGDTIYDSLFNQRQKRLKIKGKKTANWNGTLSSEGYIITDDGLKPNFDTLAADIGKYNEIGYVPVEKQVYDASRRQYGYQERKYLREFELVDDNQFDFYQGMIRSKGTKNSLEILLNSDKVLVPGNVDIYDEWALKIGEFGDVQNEQRLDLKINQDEIKDENQTIQIIYPENIVSIVDEVEVLSRTTKFYTRPILEIESPPADIPGSFSYGGGTTAEATVNLDSNGLISNVVVTEKGYGYTVNPSVTVVAAQLLTANLTTYFSKPYAISSDYLPSGGDFSGNALTGIYITDWFANVAYANTFIDLSSASNIELVADAINAEGNINANIVARAIEVTTSTSTNYLLEISGNDFELSGQGNSAIVDDITNKLLIEEKRYQPRQRYSFETANSTTTSDVIATVDGVETTANVDWVFDPGSRTTIVPTSKISGGSVAFSFDPKLPSNSEVSAGSIDADNLTIIDGIYPHIDVLLNGVKLEDSLENNTTIGYQIFSNNTIKFYDVDSLPGGELNESSVIEIVEYGTLDFEDTYQGDLPGSTLNIKVTANDALAAKLKQLRTFEVTPDDKNDSVVLIDVDDSNRMIHRPSDMATYNLWPMTSSVSYMGIVDSKYTPLPNSGYVSKYNVNYQAYDLEDFEKLFDSTTRKASKIPQEDSLVHFAVSEHQDFDVYKLTNANANTAFVEFNDVLGTSMLYTSISLNDLTDGNNVSGDYTKYYDYVVALKRNNIELDPYYANLLYPDGEKYYDPSMMELNTPVALFLNEEEVVKNSFDVTGIGYAEPMVLVIDKIEPVLSGNITDVTYYNLNNTSISAEANVVGNSVVRISIDSDPDDVPGNIQNGYYVTFTDSTSGNLDSNTYSVSNLIVGRVQQVTTASGTANVGVQIDDTFSANSTSDTVLLNAGSNLITVGMNVFGAGINANTTVIQVNSNSNIQLSDTVNVTSSGSVSFTDTAISYTVANVITTQFDITDANVSANVDSGNLSFVVNDGLQLTTDANISTLATGGDVKINHLGPYDGRYRVKEVNSGSNTFVIGEFYAEPFSVSTVFVGVDTNTIQPATANSFITPGMSVTGGNVSAGTVVVSIDSDGNIELSSNANSSVSNTITFSDNLTANATFVNDEILVTFEEDHDLATDGTDSIIEQIVNIQFFDPTYYNWAWEVLSVDTANTITLKGYGWDHPYTTGGNTYVSKQEYETAGVDARLITGDPDANAYLISYHLGDIRVNGALLARAFPMFNSDEYADEINRQAQLKFGSVINCGSFQISIPYITAQTLQNIKNNLKLQGLTNSGQRNSINIAGVGSIGLPTNNLNLGKTLPANTINNINSPIGITPTRANTNVVYPTGAGNTNPYPIVATNASGVANPSGSMIIGGRYGAPAPGTTAGRGNISLNPTPPVNNTITTVVPPSKAGSIAPPSAPTSNFGTTVADLSPLISITQNDKACPPPPPPPPTPPAPPVVDMCEKVKYTQGRGVTEKHSFKFATDTSKTYPITILFDMYSARDKMTVYQSTSSGGTGRVVASTSGLGLSQQSADDQRKFANHMAQSVSAYTTHQNYTDGGSGYVYENGKLSFTYDASQGSYITVQVEKDKNTSTAFVYLICYPSDSSNPQTPSAGTSVGNPPSNPAQSNYNNGFGSYPNPTMNINPGSNYIPSVAPTSYTGNYPVTAGVSTMATVGGAYPQYTYGQQYYSYPTYKATTNRGTYLVAQNGGGSGVKNTVNTTALSATNQNKFVSITPMTASQGQYTPIKSATAQIPLCPPKARVKICGETKSVGQGDTFYLNGDSISLSGATSLEAVRNEILSQTDKVTVSITTSPATNEKCLLIRNKLSDPMVIRNGCAGGVYKEVLDYTLQRDAQVCFNKDMPTVSSATTNTVAGNVVTSSSTTFTTNTILPESNLANNIKSSICLNKGKDYNVGDKLRVMGGTPVVSIGTSGITKIQVNNPGSGYTLPGTGTAMNFTITIGQRGEPGSGAVIDYANIEFDANGGINSVPLLAEGSGYSIDNPPTITVRGIGIEAQLSARLTSKPAVERPAKFIVTEVDNDGAIKEIQVIDRGLYKIFPSDLDSGVPLEYDFERPQAGTTSEETLGDPNVTKGAGHGARVFLTARDVPDCREKGTALTDLGLPEGIVQPTSPAQQFVDDIGIYSTYDPDGNPYFTAQLTGPDSDGDGTGLDTVGAGGLGEILIGGPNIDGLRLGDELNPGLLTELGIIPGDYTCVVPPIVENTDPTGTTPSLSFKPDSAFGPLSGATGRGQGLTPWNNEFGLGMNLGNILAVENMFQYELRQIDGESPITFSNDNLTRQNVTPLVLQSMRFDTEANLDLANISNAWIDNYNSTGWAYLESNTVIRQQEQLTDIKFVNDVFTYDETTAEKEFDINLYDPFKGIIPGFIEKNITYTTQSDPVVYDEYFTKFGSNQIGATWWDTSQVRYTWYEQGKGTYDLYGYNNTERTRNWGEKFPGSEIHIYEWIESLQSPEEYTGAGTPKNTTDFITEIKLNAKGTKEVTFYYFWVRGITEINDFAKANYGRDRSIVELEDLLENPEGNRVPYFGLTSPEGMTSNMLGDLIKTEESILSINFNRRENRLSQKHTSWALAGEGDKNSTIPNELSIKMIDSLATVNAVGEIVPMPGLSEAEKYGSGFRPRQTLFKNIKDARKQMVVSLNNIFKEIKMDTELNGWRQYLPSTLNYLNTVNWYEILRVDKTNNSKIYYNEDYKPLRKVQTEKQLDLLRDILDNSIVQVQKDKTDSYKLYEYSKKADSFKLIAMENETVEWSTDLYLKDENSAMNTEIRSVLLALYQNVFVGSFSIHWNKFFFDMLKYAISEQPELNWAFKTTYLKVVKEETDLIPLKGFKVDNFDKAVDYFNEVKPYSSKIRNYSDIKKTPVEILGGSSSDFDRPPYFDPTTNTVRILDSDNSNDSNILNSDSQYAGYISSNAQIRNYNTKIVFDRVKADLFENSAGIQTQTVVASGDLDTVSLTFVPSDASRIVIKRNDIIVPASSTNLNTGNTTVTNYTFDQANNIIEFNKTTSENPELGLVSVGDVIEISCTNGFDPTRETINVSIAKNIVNITANSNANISNTQLSWTASDRLFKFDPDIIQSFTHDVENIYGEGSISNTAIVQNVSVITSLIDSGNLNNTLALVKSKVGANFQGEYLDASVFTDIVPGTHPTYFYTDTRGWDFYSWDSDVWDKDVTVNNFLGVFNEATQGNVNYRIDSETVYGFDAVTFLKHRYGPDRPEELAVIQPLETLVMDVYTSNANIETAIDAVTSSQSVRHKMFMDLFGRTDFYRQTLTGLTTVTANVNVWDTTISVADVTVLPDGTESNKGVIWIGAERIEYTGVDTANNKLLGIIRGTRGTTADPVIVSGSEIFNGEETNNINQDGRSPSTLNWLGRDGVSLTDTTNGPNTSTIIGFIQDV